jgi:methionine synthase II (cobalamin-independent)
MEANCGQTNRRFQGGAEMKNFRPELRSLSAGSLPYQEPAAACRLVVDTLDIPTWPQLPRRSFLENMYVQFSERFPGVVVTDEQIWVDRDRDLDDELERLYVAYLMNDLDYASISPGYAAGLYHCLQTGLPATLVKGQVTGPVSWGLMVADQERTPILYDDVLAEAAGKHLRLKASWMEQQLLGIADQTIIFLDEPYMSSFGSAFLSLSQGEVVTLLEEVFAGIEGLKGVHCCGNTDWSLLLSTSLDILSFDAYEYAETLVPHAERLSEFLGRGGTLAWGIVPASDDALDETVESLVERFHRALDLLTAKAIHQDDLLASALIMPSCGCGSLESGTAERVLELVSGVAKALQERYG